MAKISNEAKRRYFEKIKEYKSVTDKILVDEAKVLSEIGKPPERAGHKKLALSNACLDLVSYFVLMNNLSVHLLGVKNEAYLNTARKGCYKSIIYIEDVVTALIDAPFSEYEQHLAAISGFDQDSRYNLLRKVGFAIHSVVEGFGENSKWKWAFVELEGRFATVAKNLLDMKSVLAGLDPRVPGYESRVAHLGLTKSLMQKAADRYREKYELSTLRMDDFKLAIQYLAGLRRLHIVLGETDESEALKKKIEIWRAKMETDSKRVEQKGRAAPKKS